MPPATSIRARFGWFAIGHICVSLIGVGGMVAFSFIISRWAGWAGNGGLLPWCLCALLMLLYVPAGYLVAARRRWTRPSHQRSVLAVLLPALVAWGVAVPGLMMLVGGWGGDAGLMLLMSTAAWASPSFLLMLLAVIFLHTGIGGPFYAFVFLAGLLPPLLFYWGSLLGAKAVDNGENCDILT